MTTTMPYFMHLVHLADISIAMSENARIVQRKNVGHRVVVITVVR
jgi:hypothetical protein